MSARSANGSADRRYEAPAGGGSDGAGSTEDPSAKLLRALPHGPAARLLTRVLELDPDAVRSQASTSAASPYGDGETVSSLVAVEMAAQAAGVHQAFLAAAKAATRTGSGYVVRVRKLSISRQRFDVETPVRLHAWLIGVAPPLAIYGASAELADGSPVLRMELTLLAETNDS